MLAAFKIPLDPPFSKGEVFGHFAIAKEESFCGTLPGKGVRRICYKFVKTS